MRERPVAARSRKTPESMSCVPGGGADDGADHEAHQRDDDREASLKLGEPPAGPYLAGLPPCWMAITTKATASRPSVSPSATASMPRRRRSLSTSALDESEVEHQDRSSRRVVMVRKRSSSDGADGRDALDGDAVVEQPAQQRGDDLAIDRRLGAERHAQAALVVGGAGHARDGGEQPGGLDGAVADDVDRARAAADELVDRALGDDRPMSTIAARSQVFSTSSSRCEESSTVRPSATSSRIRSRNSRMPAGSSPFIGSSRISSSGSASRQRATPRRWRMPSE